MYLMPRFHFGKEQKKLLEDIQWYNCTKKDT